MLFQVVVHGVKGRDVVLDVANSEENFNKMTVRKLMELVARIVLKSDTADFTLLFASCRLNPENTLQDYQIRNKSNLTMVVPLPGGW